MINNRIRNYDYINKQLLEPPPIIQHKDNISELTIFNTGRDEGYYAGYEDGINASQVWDRFTLAAAIGISLLLGILIGAAL